MKNISITIIPDPSTGYFTVRYEEIVEEISDPLIVSLLTLSVPETMKTVSDLLASYVEVYTNENNKKQKRQPMD